MRELQTLNISEGKAMEAIFNACRANAKREDKGAVSFRVWGFNSEHEATLRDANGVVVAIAIVDQFDV